MVKSKHHQQKILSIISKVYAQAHCELTFSNPLQLLIATILSAQCTDVRVNQVTPKLFASYPTAQDLARAKQEDVEALIHSTGFYRNKAKNIIATCRFLVEQYAGEVPRTLEELASLPGVGRKTANVVLSNAFGIHLGVVVDTHVMRLSQRMGLTRAKTPEKIEQDLMKLVPQADWGNLSHWLIWHGRRVCSARKPQCHQCPVAELCPSYQKFF